MHHYISVSLEPHDAETTAGLPFMSMDELSEWWHSSQFLNLCLVFSVGLHRNSIMPKHKAQQINNAQMLRNPAQELHLYLTHLYKHLQFNYVTFTMCFWTLNELANNNRIWFMKHCIPKLSLSLKRAQQGKRGHIMQICNKYIFLLSFLTSMCKKHTIPLALALSAATLFTLCENMPFWSL